MLWSMTVESYGGTGEEVAVLSELAHIGCVNL